VIGQARSARGLLDSHAVSSRALDDPVLEQRRQNALAQIRQLGDPVLRLKAEPVSRFDRGLAEDVELMTRIMIDGRGVGLAAPQIGRSRRLIVIKPDEDGPVTALVNPEITVRDATEQTDSEGCLSLGEATMDVARPRAITVTALDVKGEQIEIEAEGFLARVIQHEVDHLDGVLIIDRAVDADQRREAMRELRTGVPASS
jgi:peptide deformylase